MTSSTFLHVYRPCVGPLRRSVHSGPLPILKLDRLGRFGFDDKLQRMTSLHILGTDPLLDVPLASVLSHPVGCLFSVLMVSFAVQRPFSLTRSHLLMLSLVSLA